MKNAILKSEHWRFFNLQEKSISYFSLQCRYISTAKAIKKGNAPPHPKNRCFMIESPHLQLDKQKSTSVLMFYQILTNGTKETV